MRLIGLGLTVLILTAEPGHAALSGPDRTTFLAGFNRGCVSGLRGDLRAAGVPTRLIVAMCGCAGRRLAATLDYDQTFTRYTLGQPEPGLSPELRASAMDAVQYCLSRTNVGYAGLKVTPNK
jgi:hypothetical protein